MSLRNSIFLVLVLMGVSFSFVYKQRGDKEEKEFHIYIVKSEGFDQKLAEINNLIEKNDSVKMRMLINSFDSSLANKKNCKANIFYKPIADKTQSNKRALVYKTYEKEKKDRLEYYCKVVNLMDEIIAFDLLVGIQSPFCDYKLKTNNYELDIYSKDFKLIVPCFSNVKEGSYYKLYTGSNEYFLNTIMKDKVMAAKIKAMLGTSFKVLLEEEEEHDDD